MPLIGHLHANTADPINVLKGPSAKHILGTNKQGQDVFTQILFGLQVSLGIGAAVSVASFLVGMPLGILAAYSRAADVVIMRVVDAFMSLPAILLALALVAALGPGIVNVALVLVIVWTPLTIRMARGSALDVLSQEYVNAAVALGGSRYEITWRHVLRNAIDPVLVQQTVAFAGAILGEATFSFVGAGVPPPRPSLGSILANGQQNIYQAPWIVLSAGITVALLVLSVILLGDGLRDLIANDDDWRV